VLKQRQFGVNSTRTNSLHPLLFPLSRLACAAGFLLAFSTPLHAADELWSYRVQVGDTLIGVRDRLMVPGADWQVLQRVNQVPNPRQLVPGSTLQIPLHLLRQKTLTAEVVHTHGEVQFQRPNGAFQALVGGQVLASGDVVRTGAQSSAVLRFADGTRVMMRPDSLLKIERSVRLGDSEVVDTQLRLESGSVDSRVPPSKDPQRSPRFEIRTPLANLGVRGTEFRTTASATQSAVEVLEGTVAGSVAAPVASSSTRAAAPAAAAGGGQAVKAGFGTRALTSGVEAPRALLAAPDLKATPARVERLPVQLPWVASAGAAAYRAQVFSADPTQALVLSGVFDGTSARWADNLPDGRYELRVRAIDSAGLEGLDASTAFTLKARPEPPFSTQPQGGARTTDDTLLFTWTRNAAAARYRLQIADTPDFAAPRIDQTDLAVNELRVPLPVGTHHWRLASIRDVAGVADTGPWSDALALTRAAPPPAPVSKAPQTTSDGVLLTWSQADAVRFNLQVARDPEFKQIVREETTDGAQWLLRQPEPGRYFVRVRGVDASGFTGPYGQSQQVDVARATPWWWLLVPALVLFL
jgi:hypothetical protein